MTIYVVIILIILNYIKKKNNPTQDLLKEATLMTRNVLILLLLIKFIRLRVNYFVLIHFYYIFLVEVPDLLAKELINDEILIEENKLNFDLSSKLKDNNIILKEKESDKISKTSKLFSLSFFF